LASLILVIWMYFQDKIKLSDTIIKSSAQGLMVTDTKGIITSVNPAFTSLTGYTKEEVVGNNVNILKSGKHDLEFYQKMWDVIEGNGFWQGEIWNKRKDGEIYLEWLTINAIKSDAGDTLCYAGMFSDITGRK
jgi:MFS transporter, NNP family, nitrate/nitrite transporter